MGGGSRFGGDVCRARAAIGSQRDSSRAFEHHVNVRRGGVKQVHKALNIRDRIRECRDSEEHPATTPIVIAMDVTESRGDDTLRIYEQLPSMLGSILVTDIVSDPEIMTAGIGDANCDKAPIQVSEFESDERIDRQLEKIWMEKGGGGTGEESYELLAYFLAHRTELDCLSRGEKGIVFFTGDESPYPKLQAEHINRLIGGENRQRAVSTKKIFRDLQAKYDVFFIFPRSSLNDRVQSIDREIKQRLDAAGGEYRNCYLRATLLWNDFNDLDIHCLTPSGEHIYYGSKHAGCGGFLDVDRNAGGRETRKPVENIRWKIGESKPQAGEYKFWVNNYAYHEDRREEIPFKVELEVHGKTQTIEGSMPRGEVGHDEPTFTIEFDPVQESTDSEALHGAYADEVIMENWSSLIPAENILRVADPRNSVEVMLGTLALSRGGFSLEEFEENMTTRRVITSRREDILKSLDAYALARARTLVDESLFE